MTDGDDVAVLQRVLLDQLAVYIGAVGAVQVLEKRIVLYIDDQGMVSADGRIIDTHVVIRQAADRVPFLGHVVFSQNLVVQAKN
jgi:hypothetical protein